MFVLGIEVNYSLAPRVLPRVHSAVLRECNRRAMVLHAKQDLPRHFEDGAGTRYGYEQRRSTLNLAWLYRTDRASYDRVNKLKRRGKTINRGFYAQVKAVLGLKPLEWSGQLRRQVLAPINQVIRATPSRSTLRIKTPVYATSRIRLADGGLATQMQSEALRRSAELQAITPGELRAIRADFKRNYLEVMRDPTNPRHTFLAGHGVILRRRARFGKGSP